MVRRLSEYSGLRQPLLCDNNVLFSRVIPMKIIIAPDSFKECLAAAQVADAIARGIQDVIPDADCVCIPVADGGEGTLQSLIDGTRGTFFTKMVTGPLGGAVEAGFGILGDGITAVIEMAQASGIEMIRPEQRNPLITSTYGTGELIKAALDEGAQKLIVALGGSGTNDGGSGMMSALGVRFLDEAGGELPPGGAALVNLNVIDCSNIDPRLASVEFTAACDVNNPLTGDRGASAVFGPQKGASPEMVRELDLALKKYAAVVYKTLKIDVDAIPGSGAAGGMGAALLAFLNATLKPGIDIVLDAVSLDKALSNADLVITGEGRLDHQTIHGKTPVGVAKRAAKQGIPVIAIAGSVGYGAEEVYNHGVDVLLPVVHGAVPLCEALDKGAENLERTARSIARLIKLKL